jgi:hypothetical protein
MTERRDKYRSEETKDDNSGNGRMNANLRRIRVTIVTVESQ